jgi:hypothetical protein
MMIYQCHENDWNKLYKPDSFEDDDEFEEPSFFLSLLAALLVFEELRISSWREYDFARFRRFLPSSTVPLTLLLALLLLLLLWLLLLLLLLFVNWNNKNENHQKAKK